MLHTLHYLPLRARAEQIRLILAYGCIPYNDVIVQFDTWPSVKSDQSKCLFSQLPCLTLPSGAVIAQSGAITRYVAKLAGIYPADIERAAKADMIQELTMDMNTINPILNWVPKDSESYNKLYDTYFSSFDNRMSTVQTILGAEKFLGGNAQPCHADFSLFHIVDATLTVKPDALDTFPALKDWLVHMMAIPSLQKYMKDRLQPPHVGKDKSFIRET
mmetsp:Transcript_37051/g.73750  ORF Transcript_37051/g.73750 Transcript_37051/m.73750 type:complete len:217 (-) Transcript_37051:61-711(-)